MDYSDVKKMELLRDECEDKEIKNILIRHVRRLKTKKIYNSIIYTKKIIK